MLTVIKFIFDMKIRMAKLSVKIHTFTVHVVQKNTENKNTVRFNIHDSDCHT